ncbi:hypothetical protein DFA_07678 [Cavenderia fasciculata]|uniref:Protein FAM33A n=1 Tax=Cavenderia fasciculata TaxID=261658 RepID=F4Q2S4_CACFS|nr:uncharacterized protein DFA_07678 [Cavenderia fasciculata]EGG16700.1 hypothetical protein DFA_07678 [Cavenderia fasciculata]|eukprot:XP_004355174.1 hypothetical protein DFA_07678 [Cavenderia fasciculata]
MSINYVHPIDNVKQIFIESDQELNTIQHQLNHDFYQLYDQSASCNPIKIGERIKRLQDEMVSMMKDIEYIRNTKERMVDRCSTQLINNRTMIQQLRKSTDPTYTQISNEEDYIFSNFKKIISSNNGNGSGDQQPSSSISSTSSVSNNFTTTTTASKYMLKNSDQLNLELQKTTQMLADNNIHVVSIQQQQQQQQQQQTMNQQPLPSVVPSELEKQTTSSTTTSSTTTTTHPVVEKKRSKNVYRPISEKEFNSISESIRGRCKLDDDKANAKVILTKQQLAMQGCKVLGLSGDQAILCLKALKIIDINKHGIIIKSL